VGLTKLQGVSSFPQSHNKTVGPLRYHRPWPRNARRV
jgi:hypothetical protein